MRTLVPIRVHFAFNVDQQNVNAIDLAGYEVSLPNLVQFDHGPPTDHLPDLLSILPNSRNSKQRLALASRSRHDLALRHRILRKSANEVREASDCSVRSRSPLRYPSLKHIAVIRTFVDSEFCKRGTPAITPLGIER